MNLSLLFLFFKMWAPLLSRGTTIRTPSDSKHSNPTVLLIYLYYLSWVRRSINFTIISSIYNSKDSIAEECCWFFGWVILCYMTYERMDYRGFFSRFVLHEFWCDWTDNFGAVQRKLWTHCRNTIFLFFFSIWTQLLITITYFYILPQLF